MAPFATRFPGLTALSQSECSRDLRRNLLILSKLLQNVYNQATHVKESWMEPMMPFVKQHITEVTLLSMRILVCHIPFRDTWAQSINCTYSGTGK